MSEKFTDKDGNEVKLITAENVEEFKNWLKNTKEPETFYPEVSSDLKLADLIPSNTILSEKQESVASRLVVMAMRDNASPERCAEFIRLASTSDTNRHIIGKSWRYMGNSTGGYNYNKVAKVIADTPDSKLIGFNLECVENNSYIEIGKPDDGKNLTGREKELLCILAQKSSVAVNRFVANGSLFNVDLHDTEARKVIDRAICDNNNIHKIFPDLEDKFVTKEVLRATFQDAENCGWLKIGEMKDTINAKTQAEKNVNISQNTYMRLQNAIIRETEKQNKYDASSYGRTKGLHERFVDLCNDLQLSSKVIDSPFMQKMSLQMAQRDVLQGNADNLDESMLGKVIAEDKSCELSAKLSDEFVSKHKAVLLENSPYLRLKGRVLENLDKPYNLPKFNSVDDRDFKAVPLSLKEKILAEAEKINAQKTPEKEALKKCIDMQSAELDKQQELSRTDIDNNYAAQKAIDEINVAYRAIECFIKKDKKGNIVAAEEFLSVSNINSILAGDKPRLYLPQEGSLPLFGRSAEKERRHSLDEAINAFNQIVKAHMPTLNKEVYSNGSYVSAKQMLDGKILAEDKRSKDLADSKFAKSRTSVLQRYNDTVGHINNKYGGELRWKKDNLKKFEEADKWIVDARTQLNNTKQAMKEAAYELSGVKAAAEESKLQAVDKLLEGKDKANVRKANQAVVDPLMQKADSKVVLKAAMQKQHSGR